MGIKVRRSFMHIDLRPIMLIAALLDGLILFGSISAHKRSNRILKLCFFAVIVISAGILFLITVYFIRVILFPFPLV